MNDTETQALLEDIVVWGDRLARHLTAIDEKAFYKSPLICDAACWCIVCIGEAAGRIRQFRPDIAQRHAGLELAKAYAMRNRLAHGYDTLDVGLLWFSATESVPALVEEARSAIGTLAAR